MTELRGRPSTNAGGSAWGAGHLALDALVAYVDEELSEGARRRALEHLARCPECATEVVAQTQARLELRRASAPALPSSLLHNLRDIPRQTALPEPPAGLVVGPAGELLQLQRPPRTSRRRVRLGAGAVVSGLALGALVIGGNVIGSTGGSAQRALPRASLVAPRVPDRHSDVQVEGAMLASPSPAPVRSTGPGSGVAVPPALVQPAVSTTPRRPVRPVPPAVR